MFMQMVFATRTRLVRCDAAYTGRRHYTSEAMLPVSWHRWWHAYVDAFALSHMENSIVGPKPA
jgi:hypothetical protein